MDYKKDEPLSDVQLATLARLTHERHFNSRKFYSTELLVPGGLVFALTCSLASRDLHEVISEELVNCAFPNKLNPGETVSPAQSGDQRRQSIPQSN